MRLLWCLALLSLPVAASGAPAETATKMPAAPALKDQLLRAITANDAAVARLMKRGARPDDSTLELATYMANLATWRALFAGGVSVNARIESSEERFFSGKAPLIVAVAAGAAADDSPENGRRALLRELIARAAKGVTALHIAATSGDYSMSKLLLQMGADTEIEADGKTALDIAREPFITTVYGAENPSRETRKMIAEFGKSDRQLTARRQQIARLLERQQLK